MDRELEQPEVAEGDDNLKALTGGLKKVVLEDLDLRGTYDVGM